MALKNRQYISCKYHSHDIGSLLYYIWYEVCQVQEPLFNLLGKILCILPVFKLLKDIFLFSFTSSLPLWAITTLYFLFSIRTPYIASISAHASSTICTLSLSISSMASSSLDKRTSIASLIV